MATNKTVPLRQPSILECFKKVDIPAGKGEKQTDDDVVEICSSSDEIQDEMGIFTSTLGGSGSGLSRKSSRSSSTTPDLFPELSCGSNENDNLTSLGTPISELIKSDIVDFGDEPIKASRAHTVLFKLPYRHGEKLTPYPKDYADVWDKIHVRLPCSPHCMYPVSDFLGKRLVRKWELIRNELKKPISNSLELEEAIRGCNRRQLDNWDFTGMHTFFTDVLESDESRAFFKNVLPRMADLTLRLPYLCTRAIPLLRKGETHSISFTQLQIASLLANAFFCTYPMRNSRSRNAEYSSFPSINFNMLYSAKAKPYPTNTIAKLKCLINYFKRVTEKDPIGTVTFKRQCLRKFPEWDSSERKLPRLHITSEGTIEDQGVGMLQMDFANKYIGGGVLNRGCVQEEIRFVICPELLVSRLFTESLSSNESLIITGVEQFNLYTGYGRTFTWKGDFVDETPRDCHGRMLTEIVAVDAIHFDITNDQYKPESMKREMNKAFCGFFSDAPHKLSAVATGNWGCGAFRGDPRLKSLLQLMAAAEARRDVLYFTFGDEKLSKDIYSAYKHLVDKDIKIKTLWHILEQYYIQCCAGKSKLSKQLYDFIDEELSAYDADTDVDNSGST